MIFCLLIGIMCQAQQPYIKVLPKDCVYTVPVKRVVVMDDRTFAGYHFYMEQYAALTSLVKTYDSIVTFSDSLMKDQAECYELLLASKEKQIEECGLSYEAMKATLQSSIEETRRLEIEFKTFQEKYKKKERWNRFFKITAGVLAATTTVLIIR